MNQHSRPFTAEEDAEITRLRMLGLKQFAIAEVLGRSESAVSNRIRVLNRRGVLIAVREPTPYAPTRKPDPRGPAIAAAGPLTFVPSWSFGCRLYWEDRLGRDCAPRGEP